MRANMEPEAMAMPTQPWVGAGGDGERKGCQEKRCSFKKGPAHKNKIPHNTAPAQQSCVRK